MPRSNVHFSMLLGCTLFCSPFLLSADNSVPQVSGSIRMDGNAPFHPEDKTNNIHLSGATLKVKGQIIPHLKYDICFKHPGKAFDTSLSDNRFRITSATVKWEHNPNHSLTLGKTSPNYAQADSKNAYITRSLGVLTESIGDQLGVKAEGTFADSYGYSLGVWKATARKKVDLFFFSEVAQPTAYSEDEPGTVDSVSAGTGLGSDISVNMGNQGLKLGLGGRLNGVFLDNPRYMWGGGVGYQSLGVIVPLVAEYDSGSAQQPVSTFESRYAYTVDQSFGMRNFVVNVAFHHFKYLRQDDEAVSTLKDNIAEGVNAFQSKNTANAGYAELSWLLIGDGYAMDKSLGAISNVKLSRRTGNALEVAVRAGVQSYFNGAAAQYLGSSYNENEAVPFVFSKKTGYNQVLIANGTSDDIHVRTRGMTAAMNYYMNSNMKLKFEYYNEKVEVVGQEENTTLEHRDGLRLRSEYSF